MTTNDNKRPADMSDCELFCAIMQEMAGLRNHLTECEKILKETYPAWANQISSPVSLPLTTNQKKENKHV